MKHLVSNLYDKRVDGIKFDRRKAESPEKALERGLEGLYTELQGIR